MAFVNWLHESEGRLLTPFLRSLGLQWRIKAGEEKAAKENGEGEEKDEDDSDSAARKSTFNQLVSKSEKSVAKTRRRP